MSQVTSYTIPGSPLTMATLATNLEALFAAAASANRGAVAPSNPFEGMLWWDSAANPEILKRYTVTGGWASLLSVNITTGAVLFSAYDADLATLSLPANTTITAAAATILDDASVTAILETLIASSAQGDLLARGASAWARMAKGAAGQKLYMNATADGQEWASGIKIGNLSRYLNAASGDVAYTGVGFKPSVIIFLAYASVYGNSVGFDNVTAKGCMCNYVNLIYGGSTSVSIIMGEDGNTGKSQTGFVKSLDTDGFTITWARNGATGSIEGTVVYLALR
jgi:hypothetical protein